MKEFGQTKETEYNATHEIYYLCEINEQNNHELQQEANQPSTCPISITLQEEGKKNPARRVVL